MRIRLIRKLADHLDGIDVSPYVEGDIFELTLQEAELLIAEGWAVASDDVIAEGTAQPVTAGDFSCGQGFWETAVLEQLRHLQERTEIETSEHDYRRRADDIIRETHHDSQAKTVKDDQ
jgi:hypothetical protein